VEVFLLENLEGKLFEAKTVLAGMKIYSVFLDFIAAFIAFSIAFEIFGVNIMYSAAPASLYSIIRLVLALRRQDIVPYLRGSYGGLGERLKTALDNQGRKNIIVEDLVGDVTKRMDDVESSVFFNPSSVSKRIATIVILAFLFFSIIALDLRGLAHDNLRFLLDDGGIEDALNLLSEATSGGSRIFGDRGWEDSGLNAPEEQDRLGGEAGGETPGISEGPLPGQGGGIGIDSGGDIFGDASSASLAGKDVEFKMHPEYGGDIEVRDAAASHITRKFNLEDVLSVEECPDCSVGPENEDMVRRYFESITYVS
jgi:hypothetical protein